MVYEPPSVVEYGPVEQITENWKGGDGVDQDVEVPEGTLGSEFVDSLPS